MAVSDAELDTLARAVGAALKRRNWRLATAESCTAGWIGKVITDIPGSSDWYDRGFIVYSNPAKVDLLGVLPETLETHGAVSEATAREMARGVLNASHADIGTAVTGIAGPDGGTPAKPVGTVWLAWAWRDGRLEVEHHRFQGDREAIRRASVGRTLARLADELRA